MQDVKTSEYAIATRVMAWLEPGFKERVLGMYDRFKDGGNVRSTGFEVWKRYTERDDNYKLVHPDATEEIISDYFSELGLLRCIEEAVYSGEPIIRIKYTLAKLVNFPASMKKSYTSVKSYMTDFTRLVDASASALKLANSRHNNMRALLAFG